MKKLGLEPFIHGLLWMLFISGEVYSLSVLTNRYSTFAHYFFFYLLNISLFYSYLWLLHKIPRQRPLEIVSALAVIVFEISVYVLLAAWLTMHLESTSNQGQRITALDQRFYVSTLWRGAYFMLFATAYFLVRRQARQREHELKKAIEVEKLQKQLIITEKNFLRSQINPHLLFNTINFIKHAIKHNPGNASIALGSLSDVMDYALENSKREFVPLFEEVKQIENMISLNRLRFGEKLKINFSKHIENPKMQIIPIILLTIVENVFKHANLTDQEHPVEMVMENTSTTLSFKTMNAPSNNSLSKGTQTGLENIRQRLKASYNDRHDFKYGMREGSFFTELVILT